MGEAKKIYGHCRACHMNCPAYFVVEDGRLTGIEPVPVTEGGTNVICGRGIASSLQLEYSPTRVRYPLKRAGKRGEGKWERISWDQAISEIAEKVHAMSKRYGPETFVLPGRTGRQDMGWIAHRIARTIGTPNNYYGPIQVCLLPQMHTVVSFGNMTNQPFGIDPTSKLWVGVGVESAYAWPVFGPPTTAAEAAGGKRVLLDPVGGVKASRADEWLPVMPGTDLAYFMGAIRHLIATGTYDAPFVKEWTNAAFLVRDETGALLTEADTFDGGKADRYPFFDASEGRVKYWDAGEIQWEGGKSGKAHFEECVERFKHNVGSTELSPSRLPEHVDPALEGTYEVVLADGRTVTARPAFALLAESVADMTPEKVVECCGIDAEQVARTYQMISETRPVDFYEGGQYMSTNASQFFNADASLNFPDINCVLKAAEDGDPYEVHGIFAISSNWLMHDPTTARWMRLLEDESKIQLHVVTDFVMTPTAEMADYVLPAQTWMERNYLEFSVVGTQGGKNAFSRAVEPIGEARHDYDFGAALAQAASAEVGRAYVEAGFDPSHDGANEPCDHISTELRFAAFLLKRGGENDVPVLERFLAEHLGLWAPRLGRKISACAQTPVYRALGEMPENALFA